MNKPRIAVRKNIWGNYCCYVSTSRVETFGDSWDAVYWLMEQLNTEQFILSDRSEITADDVAHFAANFNKI